MSQRRLCFIFSVACALGVLVPLARADSTVRVESMGVGYRFRAGSMTPLLVDVRADVAEATEAEIAWELPGPDGDTLEVSRRVILEPGRAVRAWLYAMPVASTAAEFQESLVKVWALENGTRAGEVARTRFTPDSLQPPAQAVEADADLALVIGTGAMGLDQYSFSSRSGQAASLNAPLVVATVDSPGSLPDRSFGLQAFGLIAIGDVDPRAFPPSQAAALLEWVARGGHLVIVPTGADDLWGLAADGESRRNHPFRALLAPEGPRARRAAGVRVADILSALSPVSGLTNERATTDVWIFDSLPQTSVFRPLAAFAVPRISTTGLPDPRKDTLEGAVYAVKRTWGTGAVSIVGVDADGLSRRALQSGGLPRASTFWGPLIARRGDTLTRGEVAALESTKPPTITTAPAAPIPLLRGVVTDAIDRGSGAVIGVLVAFVVFLVYWVVAVPGSYYGLRSRGLVRHAWLAYASIALVFCAVAWIAAGAAEPRTRVARHLSVVDVVPSAGTRASEATARGWASIPLSDYGRTVVALESENSSDWLTGYADPMSGAAGFPDKQYLQQSCASLGSVSVPSRATSSLYAYETRGALASEWASPAKVASTNPVSCSILAGSTIRAQVAGTLHLAIPSHLEEAYLVIVAPVRAPLPELVGSPARLEPSGTAPLRGAMRYLGHWEADEPLDLQHAIGTIMLFPIESTNNDLDDEISKAWCMPLRSRSVIGLDAPTLGATARLAAASVFGLLTPPAYLRQDRATENVREALGISARLTRDMGHTLDLSHHTAGGALIIIGLVRGPAPVHITVDGRTVESGGDTILRIIIPLESNGAWLAPATPRPPVNP